MISDKKLSERSSRYLYDFGGHLAARDWLSMTSPCRKLGWPLAGTLLVSTRLAANSTGKSLLCWKIVPWRRHLSSVSALARNGILSSDSVMNRSNAITRGDTDRPVISGSRSVIGRKWRHYGIPLNVKYAKAIDSGAVLTAAMPRILSVDCQRYEVRILTKVHFRHSNKRFKFHEVV